MTDWDTKPKSWGLPAKIFYRIGVALLFFFAAIGIFFTTIVVQGLCHIHKQSDQTLDVTNSEIVQNIGKFAGLTFPKTIIWEHAHSSSWMDTTISCKVRARKKDIETMLADRKLEWSETKRISNYLGGGGGQKWFKPNEIKTFKSGFYDAENAEVPHEYPFFEIFYDNSDPEDGGKLRTCYFVFFTT